MQTGLSIYTLDEATIRKVDDSTLISLDRRTHKIWRNDCVSCANDHRLGRLVSTLTKVHNWIVDELRRRGIFHSDGGPALHTKTEKIRSDFGDFIREVPIENMPVVRVPKEAADRFEQEDISFLVVPKLAAALSVIDSAPVKRFVVVAGDNAIGTLQLLLPGNTIRSDQEVPNSLKLKGAADEFMSIGVVFLKLASPVGVRLEGEGILLRGGSLRAGERALEKARNPAVLAFIFNEDDEVLLVFREEEPEVWGPPAKLLEAVDDVEGAAREVVSEQTSIKPGSLWMSRELEDLIEHGVVATVGRGDGEITLGDKIVEGKWISLSDLDEVEPLVPPAEFFARALEDLRTFEEAETAEKMLDRDMVDITPSYLRGLSKRALAILGDIIADRSRTWEDQDELPDDYRKAGARLRKERQRRGMETKETEKQDPAAGAHAHPHEENGAHSHDGLPENTGGHSHIENEVYPDDAAVSGKIDELQLSLGGHRHRPDDPIEGVHIGTDGSGEHKHPRALGIETELPLDLLVELHESRPWLDGFVRAMIRERPKVGAQWGEWRPWSRIDSVVHVVHPFHQPGADAKEHGRIFLDDSSDLLIQKRYIFDDGNTRSVTAEDFSKEAGWIAEFSKAWKEDPEIEFEGAPFDSEPQSEVEFVVVVDGERKELRIRRDESAIVFSVTGDGPRREAEMSELIGDEIPDDFFEASASVVKMGTAKVYQWDEDTIALEKFEGERAVGRMIARRMLGDHYMIAASRPKEDEEMKQDATEVQSLIFDKEKFSEAEAIQWAKENDFRADKVDETGDSYRLRQKPPAVFMQGSLRTIELKPGIKAVIGRPEQKTKFSRFIPIVHTEEIEKAEEKKRLIYGVVYEPFEVDAQGDWTDEATIEKAAHRWMLESQKHKIMHRHNTDKIRVVESYVAPQDLKIGRKQVKKGSWILVVKALDESIWKDVQDGKLTGFSLGGRASSREENPPR